MVKVIVLVLLLAIATTATTAISSVNPKFNAQLSVDQGATPNTGRVRRSSDGFDVDDMPKTKLSRGTFADEKSNVVGVKKDSGGVMAIIIRFIKEILAHFNMNFD